MKNLLVKLEEEGIVKKGIYSAAFATNTSDAYIVIKNGKSGVINSKGELIIGCRYECIAAQTDGTYKCIRFTGRYYDTDILDSQFNYI